MLVKNKILQEAYDHPELKPKKVKQMKISLSSFYRKHIGRRFKAAHYGMKSEITVLVLDIQSRSDYSRIAKHGKGGRVFDRDFGKYENKYCRGDAEALLVRFGSGDGDAKTGGFMFVMNPKYAEGDAESFHLEEMKKDIGFSGRDGPAGGVPRYIFPAIHHIHSAR